MEADRTLSHSPLALFVWWW